jgi:hypothetical protein
MCSVKRSQRSLHFGDGWVLRSLVHPRGEILLGASGREDIADAKITSKNHGSLLG